MSAKRILLVAWLALLASCGREADLRLAPGQSMPVKPEMARASPTVKQLLAVPTQARPTRIDELVTRSAPRPDDPFDLPPPTGGEAPPGPTGMDPGAVSNNSTAVPPGE